MNLVEQRVVDFVAATASKEPTPGGGAIAALTGATGAALAEMVANLTFGKKAMKRFSPKWKNFKLRPKRFVIACLNYLKLMQMYLISL